MKLEELYTSGEYLAKNPTWHAEEAPWKVKHIVRMLAQNDIAPDNICEVGCGVGEVLKLLQMKMDTTCSFWGYEISPQAFELSMSRANERLHFRLADIRQEKDISFDLILVLDVIEHLEDYFSFLRDLQPKSSYKIIHIPLDLSVESLLRPHVLQGVRSAYGHVHYFTKEIALDMLKDAGYEVLDYFYTPRANDMPNTFGKKLLIYPRKLFFSIHRDIAVRILGGYSLLILAK